MLTGLFFISKCVGLFWLMTSSERTDIYVFFQGEIGEMGHKVNTVFMQALQIDVILFTWIMRF